MSNDPSDNAQTKAVAHVQKVADVSINATNATTSNGQIAPVIAAYAQDLQDGVDKSIRDEARLVKVEAQTHVLAEAMVAMTQTAHSLAPAVKAVKDEMLSRPALPDASVPFETPITRPPATIRPQIEND